jgi:hypothetical protein
VTYRLTTVGYKVENLVPKPQEKGGTAGSVPAASNLTVATIRHRSTRD